MKINRTAALQTTFIALYLYLVQPDEAADSFTTVPETCINGGPASVLPYILHQSFLRNDGFTHVITQ